ncbi:MAG: anti-sigma factor domain-containing protein [Actinomycetota bacterium]
MTHDDLRGLIPLLALASLPSDEERELIAHLKVCRDCSELQASFEGTAGSLGMWAPPLAPPVDLKDRVMRQAAQSSQLTAGRTSDNVVELARRRPGMRVAAALATAAVFAFGGFTARQYNLQSGEIEEQRQLLAAQRKALSVAGSGRAVVLPLKPTGSYEQVGGNVVISDRTAEVAVLMTGLDVPKSSVYTLWLIHDNEAPQNVADFVPDQSGLVVVNLKAAVGDSDTLAVTLEPRKGATMPSGPLIGSAERDGERSTLTFA